jgi:hypothetical protein
MPDDDILHQHTKLPSPPAAAGVPGAANIKINSRGQFFFNNFYLCNLNRNQKYLSEGFFRNYCNSVTFSLELNLSAVFLFEQRYL